jgi:hypothetical protein
MQPQSNTSTRQARIDMEKAIIRSSYVGDVMQVLYRARSCSPLARREDIPKDVEGLYRQIAEVAIMLVTEPHLRETAEYFAAHQVAVSREMDFFRLPLQNRWQIVQDTRLVVARFLAFCRGEWPAALQSYQDHFQRDKAAIVASNARTAEQARSSFAVLPGGVDAESR